MRPKSFRKVKARRIALDIGGQCQDQFPDRLGFETVFKRIDAQIFRANAVNGRNPAAKDMVTPAKLAGLVDGDNVHRALDNANHACIALFIGAKGAR